MIDLINYHGKSTYISQQVDGKLSRLVRINILLGRDNFSRSKSSGWQKYATILTLQKIQFYGILDQMC